MSRAMEIMEVISSIKKHAKGISKEYHKNVQQDMDHGTIGNPVTDFHSMAMAPIQYATKQHLGHDKKKGKK